MGSTKAISKTLEGQVSNLGDTADQTAVVWGQSLRPAFVAVLSTIGFLLGALKALPGFVSENRGVLLALAGAVLTFNVAQVEANALLLYNAALSKGKVVWDTAVTVATKAWEVAQRGLNLALSANPIGAVIAVGTLLIGVLVALYDKSEKFRAVVAGLGAALKAFATTYVKGVIEQLTGLGDILLGVFTLDSTRIKKGIQEVGTSLKNTYYDAGRNAAAAYQQGYQGKLTEEQAKISERNGKLFDDAERAFQRRADAAAKAKIEVDKKASLEALKNREADIQAALALVASGSAEELRLKKLDVAAKRDIELADEKKTAAERKVIKAEATAAIRKLDEDYQKEQLAAAEKRAKDEADIEKRIADLKAGLVKDETERKIAQLTAAAEKEKATAKGTAEQIAKQRRLIEQKLAVDVQEMKRQAAQKQKLEELSIEQQGNALIKNE